MKVRFSLLLLVLLSLPLFASAQVIEACVNPGNGGLRLVAAGVDCRANEVRVQWNVAGPAGAPGPAGPAGPAGPQGPAGTSGGGPPYTFVCTPGGYFSGGYTNAAIHVFNGGPSTANIAINFLNKDGVNLSGTLVPGAPVNPGDPAPTYPGQSGASTVTLAAANTMVLYWLAPAGNPASGGGIAATIRVVSDQPIAAGTNIEFSGFHPMPCMQLAH